MEKITSIKHELVVKARNLNTSTGRKASGRILLEGMEVINFARKSGLVLEYCTIEENISL